MPKLLQITVTVARGSQGKIADQIGKLAIDNGWESWIAYSAYWGCAETESKLIGIGSKADFYEHALETRLFDNHGLASRCATKKLIKQIEEIKPDIIHLHNVHGYYLNYRILFKYLSSLKTPVVWTLHDSWTMTGHCAFFDLAGCQRWKTGCFDCPLKSEYPKSVLMDRSARNWEKKKEAFTTLKNLTIVPVSHWLEGVVKESYLGKYPIKVIQNGIDLNLFKPLESTQKAKGQDERFTLLGVSCRWEDRKGLDDFIELSRLLSPDERIVLVGVQDELIDRLPENIISVKYTDSREELAQLYQMSDVVLSLSHAEAMGLTPVEGMACGKPAIVYDNSALPELVDDNTGIVVRTGDIEGVYQAIQKIKNSDGSRYSASQCRARVESLFGKDERFDEYLRLYDGLLMESAYEND